MGRILGSWSGMRVYLEQEMLATALRGRVLYSCTAYTGMDGSRVFGVSVDGKTVKRFSLETVNTFFINNGYRSKADGSGLGAYWEGFMPLLHRIPVQERTEYTDDEFCAALEQYRNQPVQDSLASDNPIVRMFAVLDRRVGKRTLASASRSLDAQPDWLQSFYRLRLEAEHIPV